MAEQVIAFLLKYQEMRRLRAEYNKNFNRYTLAKFMKLELELDKDAELLKSALSEDPAIDF